MKARVLRYLAAAVVFGTLAVVAARFGYNLWQRTAASRLRQANRNAMAHVLQTADVDAAAGPDGVVLKLKAGAWIAIRYVKGSSQPSAVARDSGGNWFESDRAFGNALGHYRYWQEPRASAKAANDPLWSEDGFLALGLNAKLDAIEQSADLAQARQRLRELGFEEFKP